MAANSMSMPYFPGLRQLNPKIDRIISWSRSHTHPTAAQLGSSFARYRGNGLHPRMVYLLESVTALTYTIDCFLHGKAMDITLQDIVDRRTAIQHGLLSLRPGSEMEPATSPSLSVYECCRLTALIYSTAVVFPIPNSWKALQKLVKELKTAIGQTEMIYDDCNANLLLWMLVLGGTAAEGKQERPWYVEQLGYYARTKGIEDWEDVEDTMHEFLWLSSACRPAGMKLWAEVS